MALRRSDSSREVTSENHPCSVLGIGRLAPSIDEVIVASRSELGGAFNDVITKTTRREAVAIQEIRP